MPSPRTLEKYPYWMIEAAGSFEPPQSRRSLVYTLPDVAAAKSLRLQFYGLQRVLRRDSMKDYPNFISCRLVIRGSDLHIIHADDFIPQPPEKQDA